MNSFWILVGFEYRKIFRKKSILFTLTAAVAVMVICVWGTLIGNYYIDGKIFESNYEAMVKDRANARALAGRTVDAGLLMEAAAAYATIPDDAPVYQATEEYQKNARPYSEIYGIARQIYSTQTERFGMDDLKRLEQEQAEDFYGRRLEVIEQRVNDTQMSGRAKIAVVDAAERTAAPFVFSYRDGYTRFFTVLNLIGLIAAFCMAVCISPLFAGEYSCGADQLILSSRFGKNKEAAAKVFTGFSVAGLISVALTAVCYLQCMLTYGFDGGNAALQLYTPLSSYPLTMAQLALLQSVCVLFACLMTAAVTMVLSSLLKSSFGVIILSVLLLFVPMMVKVSDKPLIPYQLFRLLPSSMMGFEHVTGMIPYEVFGLIVPPYAMMPAVAALMAAVLAPAAYWGFRRHQIG